MAGAERAPAQPDAGLRKKPEPRLECWEKVTSIDLGDGVDAGWLEQFPLCTSGRNVVTKAGDKRFRLVGVNWYGASDAHHVVGGLDVQSMERICQSVVALGFNVVRLPFSNEMLRSSVPEHAVDFKQNPTLRGLSALEVLDETIRCLGRHRIAVVLNNHTTYGEWCGGPDRNGLWYSPSSEVYTEQQWIEDWAMLARRYQLCPHVIGFDLRNEVRFCPPARTSRLGLHLFRWPLFGGGCAGIRGLAGAVDWAQAAVAAAERVAAVNQALIIVERIVWPSRTLRDYAACPGPLLPRFHGRLVLGVHHYAWSGPGRYLAFGGPKHLWPLTGLLRKLGFFSPANYGDMDREALFEQFKKEWGFVLEEGICPVWISEFGASVENPSEMYWLKLLVEYLAEKGADWAYWPLNVGPKPSCGGDESYGMLSPSWTPKPDGDERLTLLQAAGLGRSPSI
eukprot:TRINITY_DN7827_c0_g1_i1.p1 TRINITY_DN7827_c0_g1~~TRINITY_DN7827_c0_g1_i1.p1  ORF type:complete len:463 (+),score=86.63 TRINITY_DN7827_c0_g1_i1:38-1390(+)